MYLLDTNALSEPLKRRPSPAFLQRLASARSHRLCTSAVCVMELRYGCARHPSGERLWRRVNEEVLSRVDILPVDERVAEKAGDLLAHVEKAGHPRGTEDLLIAATGWVHGFIVVTRNRRDFDDLPDVRVEDWMSASFRPRHGGMRGDPPGRPALYCGWRITS